MLILHTISMRRLKVLELQREAEIHIDAIKKKEAEAERLMVADLCSKGMIDELTRTIKGAKDKAADSVQREGETALLLEMQTEQNQELEARLEQTLMRW